MLGTFPSQEACSAHPIEIIESSDRQNMHSEYSINQQPSVLLSGLQFMHDCQIVDISNVPIPCSPRQLQKVYMIVRVGLFAKD